MFEAGDGGRREWKVFGVRRGRAPESGIDGQTAAAAELRPFFPPRQVLPLGRGLRPM
jgi:hypothetical protein